MEISTFKVPANAQCVYTPGLKGVVWSKISRGYLKVDIAFYPNKIGQKLTDNWGIKHAYVACFENIPANFAA